MENVDTRVMIVGGSGDFSRGFDTAEDINAYYLTIQVVFGQIGLIEWLLYFRKENNIF